MSSNCLSVESPDFILRTNKPIVSSLGFLKLKAVVHCIPFVCSSLGSFVHLALVCRRSRCSPAELQVQSKIFIQDRYSQPQALRSNRNRISNRLVVCKWMDEMNFVSSHPWPRAKVEQTGSNSGQVCNSDRCPAVTMRTTNGSGGLDIDFNGKLVAKFDLNGHSGFGIWNMSSLMEELSFLPAPQAPKY